MFPAVAVARGLDMSRYDNLFEFPKKNECKSNVLVQQSFWLERAVTA